MYGNWYFQANCNSLTGLLTVEICLQNDGKQNSGKVLYYCSEPLMAHHHCHESNISECNVIDRIFRLNYSFLLFNYMVNGRKKKKKKKFFL